MRRTGCAGPARAGDTMAILGIESLIYGVDDLEQSTRFWDDFGLVPLARAAEESIFEVASGSRIVNLTRGDSRLPAAFSDRPGVHETIWGVDSHESLEALVQNLSRDRV